MLQQQQYRAQSQQPGQAGYNSNTPKTQGNNDSAGGNDAIKNHSSRVKSKASVFQYKGKHLEIRDVYNDTLIQEMAYIRKLVSKYKYVAMDTEFPGVVARPISDGIAPDQQYQTLRCNVDLLKIIQLGVAFFDENGELAPECPCWQFNFRFSLDDDMFAQDSIELLQHSGIDFKEHNARGIDVHDFGELLISSGLVLMPGITWITFHGGFDFGYLLKVLTCKPLPENEDAFFALLRTYFPSTYDEKYMAKMGNGFQGGLNQLGDDLQVERIGQMHQAGSDSLLTGQVFFKLRDVIFGGVLRKDFESILYGLGVDRAPNIRLIRNNKGEKMKIGGLELDDFNQSLQDFEVAEWLDYCVFLSESWQSGKLTTNIFLFKFININCRAKTVCITYEVYMSLIHQSGSI